MSTKLETPILFLIFNRPDTTQKVFARIREQRPKYLFVAADGSRDNKEGEKEKCELARKVVIENIDWDCELKILFREKNLGCKNAVEGALEWFFNNVEEGIILEDDVLPNESFFDYCSILLEKYRKDEKIFSINGCSLGFQNNHTEYGVTNYFNMWGWATWKRSFLQVKKNWDMFVANPDILNDPTVLSQLNLHTIWGLSEWYKHWQEIFHRTATGEINTWDYQWVYTGLKMRACSICPSQNYIINLGFDKSATHTMDSSHVLANLEYGYQKYPKTDFKSKGFRDLKYEREFVAKKWNNYKIFENSKFYKLLIKLKFISLKHFLKNKFKSFLFFFINKVEC